MNSNITARFLLCVLTGAILYPISQGAAPPPSDPLEEKLPAGALRRFGSIRFRQANHPLTVDWSSDGAIIVTANDSGPAMIWDANTGLLQDSIGAVKAKRLPKQIMLAPSIRCVRFAPSGKAIYKTGTADYGKAHVLSRIDLTSQVRITFPLHTDSSDIAVSPTGNAIATKVAKSIMILDATTLKPLHTLAIHRFGPGPMSFSRRGNVLASADAGQYKREDCDIFLTSVADGSRIGTLAGHTKEVYTLALSPAADILISSSRDNTTRIWDVTKKREIRKLDEFCGRFTFSRDGKRLAACSEIGEVRIYDTATWKVVRSLSDCGAYGLIAFSPDGKRLVAAGQSCSLRIWDVATGKEILARPGHQDAVSCIRFSADGTTLFSLGADHRIIRWDVASAKELGRLPLNTDKHFGGGSTHGLAVSADGKQMASIDGLRRLVSRGFLLWDRADDPSSRRVLYNPGIVDGLALSPDGRTVAVTSVHSGEVRLWDRDSGQSILFLVDPAAKPDEDSGRIRTGGKGVAFSSDNRTLAAIEERQVLLWNWRSGEVMQRLPVAWPNQLSHGTFSPGGHLVAACGISNPSRVFLWESASGKPFGVFELNPRAGPSGAFSSAFSPDGRLLAVAEMDGKLRVWDVFAREQLAVFEGHTGNVFCVEFSPDGRTLASGSADTTILLWDVSKLRPSLPLSASSPKGLARWWDDLASDDHEIAFRALTGLAGGDETAVEFLSKRLEPIAKFRPGQLDALIKRLDDDSRLEREAANAELEKLGLLAEPVLRRTLAGRPSFEVKKRAKNILHKAEALRSTPEALRTSRAILALELMYSPAATKCLRLLAEGEPDAEQTRAAKSALARLRHPSRRTP